MTEEERLFSNVAIKAYSEIGKPILLAAPYEDKLIVAAQRENIFKTFTTSSIHCTPDYTGGMLQSFDGDCSGERPVFDKIVLSGNIERFEYLSECETMIYCKTFRDREFALSAVSLANDYFKANTPAVGDYLKVYAINIKLWKGDLFFSIGNEFEILEHERTIILKGNNYDRTRSARRT